MLQYHAGLSYEKAGMFAGASYEAVREWYQKGKELFEASIKKKRRKWIAVDEKEITVNGTTIFIWGAVDLDDEKVVAVWVSFGRSGLEAKAFLKESEVCLSREIARDIRGWQYMVSVGYWSSGFSEIYGRIFRT